MAWVAVSAGHINADGWNQIDELHDTCRLERSDYFGRGSRSTAIKWQPNEAWTLPDGSGALPSFVRWGHWVINWWRLSRRYSCSRQKSDWGHLTTWRQSSRAESLREIIGSLSLWAVRSVLHWRKIISSQGLPLSRIGSRSPLGWTKMIRNFCLPTHEWRYGPEKLNVSTQKPHIGIGAMQMWNKN